jgi:two-component system, cell cycle response regulator
LSSKGHESGSLAASTPANRPVSLSDLEAENRELRAHLARLKDEAAYNERLLKKSQERELELLKTETLPQLFNLINEQQRQSQKLDAATLVLWDPQHEIRHLLIGDHERLEDFPNVIFTDSVVSLSPQFNHYQKPWLGSYSGADHQLLFPGQHALKSVALIPLWRQQQLHGSLNLGSNDPKRFTRNLGTDFMAHLGAIASLAVENAINRARLVRSGLTDFLTGWHNRRYLHARLIEELVRAQRQGTGLVCLLIDLDRFKQINDQYGHLVGDYALREAAQRVDTQVRGSDAAARFGGDEFVVLAPTLSSEQAAALAERIRAAVSATPIEVAKGVMHTLTVSIGVAGVTPAREGTDYKTLAESLLAEADAALYRAKQQGRNRVELATI